MTHSKPLNLLHYHECGACPKEFVCCCAKPKQRILCLSCADLEKQLVAAELDRHRVTLERVN